MEVSNCLVSRLFFYWTFGSRGEDLDTGKHKKYPFLPHLRVCTSGVVLMRRHPPPTANHEKNSLNVLLDKQTPWKP